MVSRPSQYPRLGSVRIIHRAGYDILRIDTRRVGRKIGGLQQSTLIEPAKLMFEVVARGLASGGPEP